MQLKAVLVKSWEDFSRVRMKEKRSILFLLLFCFGAGFIGTMSANKIAIEKKPVESTINNNAISDSTSTTLSFVVPNHPVRLKEDFIVTLSLSSPSRAVDAADFILYFDPKVLKPKSITNGNFFSQYPVKKIDKNFIKISAVASFIGNKITTSKGFGTIATITFTAIAETNAPTMIYLDPEKTVIASEGKNIIENYPQVTISVQEPSS